MVENDNETSNIYSVKLRIFKKLQIFLYVSSKNPFKKGFKDYYSGTSKNPY